MNPRSSSRPAPGRGHALCIVSRACILYADGQGSRGLNADGIAPPAARCLRNPLAPHNSYAGDA